MDTENERRPEDVISDLNKNPVYNPDQLSVVLGEWLQANGISDPRTIKSDFVRNKTIRHFWNSVKNDAGISINNEIKNEIYNAFISNLD